MSLAREEKHLPILIAVCLAGNFVLGGLGQSFTSGSFGQILSWQVGSLFYMAGCCLYAAKLHTDKWHISSAGFILLSIGQGIFYTMQNAATNSEAYPLFAAGIMVFIPGMAFICYYSGFPVWLRIMGLVSTIPFVITMVKIDLNEYDLKKDALFTAIGFFLIQFTSLFWSYFVLRPYRKTKIQH
ncbi:MAG: hypothetical protein ACHQD9_02265 [Chitinophagales bacterium]